MTTTQDPSDGGTQDAPGEPVPTLVFIHGFLDNRATWAPLIVALSGKQLSCVALDLRGAGERAAQPGPFSLAQAVEDVLAVLDQSPHDPVCLIGHSMGAQIAELTALRAGDRVKALVLLTPTPLQGNTLPDEVRSLLRESGGDPSTQRQIRVGFSRTLPPAELERSLDTRLLMGPQATRGYYDAFTAGTPIGDLPCRYPGPTLLLGASADPVIAPEMVRQIHATRFGSAQLAFIAGSGHWPQLEQPERTAAALWDFLSSRFAPSGNPQK